MVYLKEDLKRYFADPITPGRVCRAVLDARLWAIVVFRVGKSFQKVKIDPLRKALMLLYFFLYKTTEAFGKVRISSYTEIGPGFVIRGSGINVIRGKIGRNCEMDGGVQLTSRSDGRGRGWPTLGDNVRVRAGAKIVGDVRIGNNVEIEANAVVATDVPDDSVVECPQSTIRSRATKDVRADQLQSTSV